MGDVKPQIGDLELQRAFFSPGDRVIVRMSHFLDKGQCQNIVGQINKMARCEVRILFVPCRDMQICLRGENGKYDELAGPGSMTLQKKPGEIEVGIVKVEPDPEDVFEVRTKTCNPQLVDMLTHWVGDGHELRIGPWA